MRLVAAAFLAGLAAAAAGAQSVAAPDSSLSPPPLPSERRPVEPGDTTLWRVRPMLGFTTLRLGGLEHFADASINKITGDWDKVYGLRAGATQRRSADVALVEAIEASFQLDPLVCVAMKIQSLRSRRGTLRTVAEAGGTRLEDSWDVSTDMILLMAGAGFNITLFVGAGFATVNLDHRLRSDLAGLTDLQEGTAQGTGTAFIPEFTMEIERDLSESLAVGSGLGYRFGGIEQFTSRYATRLNLFSPTSEIEAGGPIRNGRQSLLTSDYGGLLLVLFLTARG